MKILSVTLCVVGLLAGSTPVVLAGSHGGEVDWRSQATDAEKLAKLIETLPGTGTLMLQMADRYKNLFGAVQEGNWQFATYQVEEMGELFEVLAISRPKRAAGADNFRQTALEPVKRALEKHSPRIFEQSFSAMRRSCNACHRDSGYPFIHVKMPVASTSPVLRGTGYIK